jgi:hypothetical protein
MAEERDDRGIPNRRGPQDECLRWEIARHGSCHANRDPILRQTPRDNKIHLFRTAHLHWRTSPAQKPTTLRASPYFLSMPRRLLSEATHKTVLQWVPLRMPRGAGDALGHSLTLHGTTAEDGPPQVETSDKKTSTVRSLWVGNGSPPTAKPDPIFLQLMEKTEVFRMLGQLRTMHGHNGNRSFVGAVSACMLVQ